MSLRGSYTLSRSGSGGGGGGGVRKRSALAMYQSHYGPNMTPMVDVVMVILVFFMASAAILGPDWFLKASLPRQASGPVEEDEMTRARLTLRVVDGATRVESATRRPGPGAGAGPGAGEGAGGAAGVIGRELAAALPADVAGWLLELLSVVKAESLVIVIEPTADVPYADVVAVHEACQAAGVTKIALLPVAAEPGPAGTAPVPAPTPGPSRGP